MKLPRLALEARVLRSKNDSSWDVDYREAALSNERTGAPKRSEIRGSEIRGSEFRSGLAVTTGSKDSLIAAQCTIHGDLELSGRVQINGKVQGEISSDGELIIGEEADIKANIFGKVVTIFGRVIGDIKCDERLELHAGAHVTGNVLSPKVVIQDGVVFEGRCWMGEEQLKAEV